MKLLTPRLKRESRTVQAMISLYCRKYHRTDGLCPECKELNEYAFDRLEKCPFQEDKPTCSNCLVHCYQPGMREKIRQVMRYSGPRMIYRHPFLALLHLIDSRKKEVIRPNNSG